MSNRDKPSPAPRYDAPTQLEYAPPLGEEDRPPPLANTIVVTGGADAAVLTFYHISPNTIARAGLTSSPISPPLPHVQRHGDVVIIRSTPVARVALPFTVAIELIGDLMTSIVQGIPEIQSSGATMMERVADIVRQVEHLKAKSATPDTGDAK